MGAVETAVILAAGAGVRMKEAGRTKPKGFLAIGEMPIVEESVLRLIAAGVGRIAIVTGHCPEPYHALAERYPRSVTLVHNPLFGESGSMYSLSLAARHVTGPFLLLESDLVYERRALRELLAHPEANVVLVSGPTGSGDEVYVEAGAGGALRGMSKDRTLLGPEILGELVGITKLSAAGLEAMVRHAEGVFRTNLRLDYEDALVAAATTCPVTCHLVAGLIWSEIDDADHLARVRAAVYPALLARDGREAG